MFNTSSALRLMVAFWTFHFFSAHYPKCYERDTTVWPEADYSTIEGATKKGIPTRTVLQKCQAACRIELNTFYGIRRNGPSGGKTRCYCGDTLQSLHNSNTCSYKCGGYPCGYSQSMSVYSVCTTGMYGATCTDSCPVNCFEDVCQVISGDCLTGCKSGWYGGTCTQSCVNCNNGCTQTDGMCEPGGCESGFYGGKCDQTCPVNCGGTGCLQIDGECYSCDQGYHGKYCNQSCSNCEGECEQDNGVCKAGGCKAGFYGSKCDFSCPVNCQDGRCRKEDGVCDSCLVGYHGDNCDKVCNCLNGCQQESGICESGGCVQGYFGEKCDMSCPNCDGGCQQDTGSCTSGCLDGYHGDKCDADCPVGCSNKTCFRTNGTCAECEPGFYSNICDLTCQQNCKDNRCDFEDGSCMIKDGGLTVGEIVGIIIAVVIVPAGVIIGVLSLRRRMKKPKAVNSARNPGSDDLENDQRQANSGLPVHQPEKPVLPIHKPKAASSARNFGFDDMEIEQRPPDKVSEILVLPPQTPVPWIDSGTSDHTYEDFRGQQPYGTSKIVTVQDFPRYVSSRMVAKDMFVDDYESLPSERLYPWDAAHRDESLKLKNRFKDIYPYDYNRVVLTKLTNAPLSDYINASRIQGFHPDDKFIATLAPRKLTVNDFWRMIWEEKVDTVVMVTNLVEQAVEKCEQYWPDVGSSHMYNELNVELCKEDAWPHYAIRRMIVNKGNTKRTVVQYHFTVWPDHGVPDSVQLLNFRRKISPKIGQGRPVIIHCSAGVGRTGTLIALDYLMKQAEKQGQVDVYSCVYTLRHQRKSIIQTVEQYAFLHEALAVYFELQGDTVVTADNLLAMKPSIIGSKTTGSKSALEYKMLAKLDPKQMAYDTDYPLDPANINKNRDHKILPRMKKHVFLNMSKGGSDYINAVTVNSFCKIDAYYVTHPPLPNTVQGFWTMMDDSDSRSIVMLLTQKQKQEMPQFLPTKNKPLDVHNQVASVDSSHTRDGHYRTLTIDVTSPEKTKRQTPREILTEPWESQYMNVTQVNKKPLEKQSTSQVGSKQIKVFEITIAGDSDLIDVKVILGVYQDVQKWQLENSNQPIIVMCMNGARYSGQYVGCCNVLEMISGDQEVDVFQVAKYIRESRQEFIPTQAQYNNLYEAAALYVQQNSLAKDVYQNIQIS